MKTVTVLIPTYNRPEALAVTLTSLCGQTYKGFGVVVSDQSNTPVEDDTVIQAIATILRLHNNAVNILRHVPPKGMAEQRQFLLDQVKTPYAFFLDDDVVLELDVIERLMKAIEEEQCGFVGMGLIGWNYLSDIKPEEQKIEFWEGKVQPETIIPKSKEWDRVTLHSGANLYHTAQKLKVTPDKQKKYKLAWVGACVLYNTKKLREIGGFSFWKQLPKEHCGEDVLAQLKLMEKYGGCGILPTGAYHLVLPTTIPNREINAPEILFHKNPNIKARNSKQILMA